MENADIHKRRVYLNQPSGMRTASGEKKSNTVSYLWFYENVWL